MYNTLIIDKMTRLVVCAKTAAADQLCDWPRCREFITAQVSACCSLLARMRATYVQPARIDKSSISNQSAIPLTDPRNGPLPQRFVSKDLATLSTGQCCI